MTTSSQGSSGSTNQASGNDSQANLNSSDSSSDGASGSVAYETHRKLLNEKKKRDEELAQAREMIAKHELDAKERIEADLKQKEDYKKLLELREKELNEMKAESEKFKLRITEAKKLDAFLKAVNGVVPDRYWNMIDTDQIVIDLSTGQVDSISVAKAAETFRVTYPEIVQVKGGTTGMPQNAPAGGSASITYEEWKNLPAAEMRKHLKNVVKQGIK